MPTGARFALIVACVLWAASFVASKVALESAPPLTVVTLRLAISAVCLCAWPGIWRGSSLPRDSRTWWMLLLLSLLGTGLHYSLQTVGLQFTTASNASIYAVTAPISILILGWSFLGEPLNRRKICGTGLALIGVLGVMGGETLLSFEITAHLLGDLLVMLSIALWGLFTVVGKPVVDRISALRMIALATGIGTAMMIPVAAAELHLREFSLTRIATDGWIAIAFLGVACSFLATLLYFRALEQTESQKVGVYLYTIPLMTAAIAVPYLHEPVDFGLIAGGALVIAGVWLTERG